VHHYTPESQELFAQRSPERIPALNRWLKDYCAANDLIYLDYFSAMVDDKGLLKRDLAEDGLHPNMAGYAIMAPLAEKAIEKALKGNFCDLVPGLFGVQYMYCNDCTTHLCTGSGAVRLSCDVGPVTLAEI